MDIDTIVKKISELRELIHAAKGKPSKLIEYAHDMAHYTALLGDYTGQLKFHKENLWGSEYLKLIKQDKSATAARNLANAKVAHLTANIKKFELLHKNCHAQLSIIQSELKVLESERRSNW